MDGAKRVPDPLGRPEPIDDRTAGEVLGDVASDFASGLAQVVMVGTTAVAFLGIIAATFMPTQGSTRSARLKWRERQRAVDAAVAAQAAEAAHDRR